MKNAILSFALIWLTLLSCKKKENTVSDNHQNIGDSLVLVQQLRIDSVKVVDSIKVNDKLTMSYEQSVLVFDNIKNQSVLDSIYAPTYLKTKDFSKAGLQKVLEVDKQHYFKTENIEDDYLPDFPQTWDQKSEMKLYSHENNILTLAYESSGFSGGAHGYYNEVYKAFDLKNNKSILLNNIVKNSDDKIWNEILMKGFNKKNAAVRDMLLVDVIPLTKNFYFDKDSITFVYNQYEITAYAAGVIYVKLNWTDIKDQLKSDFLQRIKS